MTAKQAELHNMRIRSHEGRYPPSSFQEQHKNMHSQPPLNPETEQVRVQAHAPVSQFSLIPKDQQAHFQRVKASDAAHEISQVMRAAAKTQREVSQGSGKHPV